MINNDISLLKKIISFYSLSGNEEKLISFLQKKLASVSSTMIDGAGNLICQKGKKANDLAIFVHADKVGFMVSKINPRVQVVGLSDEVENLGVIISNDLILEFINEADQMINEEN